MTAMSDQILDELRSMRDTMNLNHIEVVQRLTAVETEMKLKAPLEDRVQKLEGWRSKVVGIAIASNMVFAAALAWFKRGA